MSTTLTNLWAELNEMSVDEIRHKFSVWMYQMSKGEHPIASVITLLIGLFTLWLLKERQPAAQDPRTGTLDDKTKPKAKKAKKENKKTQ